ncbi:SDR family NAD(P)-dependent oxidoreductase [Sphingobium subterraneum]|uniref:NAD(P)-dependent dehydrogenase (Short-subunit alcohol dehydrogenase family) n=1 Tax=Sphingobium subterraneum TaxID=627688 RepID=A0A841J9X7_9SPHN|nr:SDR family NAD(P)-dependent oxidoreductase [Sphingobium subterraneum]MBB6125305.1 NAD(P)-dependent dehydrogenase (short-subunit alcohol dehydrogenase family) [Sphingobium subterraneum]
MPGMTIDLKGKVALVTGAGSGIGLGIARGLLAAGATVAINDIVVESAEARAEELGDRAFALPGDVTSEASVAEMMGRIERSHGLDCLINNAGIPEPLMAITRQNPQDWQRVMDVNLKGAYLMSRAAAESFKKRRSGNIVNIASIAGMTGFPGSHAYGVSKAALIMLTKTLACELARYTVRVNAVAPGVIEAPMLGHMTGSGGTTDSVAARVPLGRVGKPEDIANAVAFLCSDFAAYITGAVLPVDGGWTAFGGVGDAARLS